MAGIKRCKVHFLVSSVDWQHAVEYSLCKDEGAVQWMKNELHRSVCIGSGARVKFSVH